jgi:hypothetical protein
MPPRLELIEGDRTHIGRYYFYLPPGWRSGAKRAIAAAEEERGSPPYISDVIRAWLRTVC